VPVNLDDSDGVNQVNLVLSYDTSRLQLLGVGPGSLTQPAQGFTISSDDDPQAGVLVVNATSAQALSGQGAGSVAVLEFQVKSAAPAGAAFVNLDASVPAAATPVLESESTQLSGVDGQGDPAIFVLSPAPSNAPGGPDDGLVNVVATRAPVANVLVQTAGAVPPAVISVQAAPEPGALPGAALVSVLSGRNVIGKPWFSSPAVPSASVPVDNFFAQYGQGIGSSPDQVWQAQALVQPSAPDPWQLTGNGLDPGSLPWWDTPGSF